MLLRLIGYGHSGENFGVSYMAYIAMAHGDMVMALNILGLAVAYVVMAYIAIEWGQGYDGEHSGFCGRPKCFRLGRLLW